MPEFIHDFDLMCRVRSPSENPDDVPVGVILDALEARIAEIRTNCEGWRDVVGHVNTEEASC
jgi:hypothetical protein